MKAYPGLGDIYMYAGSGNGNATLPPIPLPQSTMTGEIMTKARFARWASATLDIAGTDHDRNLFSGSGGQMSMARLSMDRSRSAPSGPTADRYGLIKANVYHSRHDYRGVLRLRRNRTWDDTTSTTLTAGGSRGSPRAGPRLETTP